LSQLIDRGAQADARNAIFYASQVLDRDGEAVVRGTARCASHMLDRGAQAVAQAVACRDVTLTQKEKNTRQMSKEPELTLPASSAQRLGNPGAWVSFRRRPGGKGGTGLRDARW